MQRSGIRGFSPKAPDSGAARLHPGYDMSVSDAASLVMRVLRPPADDAAAAAAPVAAASVGETPAEAPSVGAASAANRRRHLLSLTAVLVVASFLGWFWQALPTPLLSAPLSPVLFARGGELLGARIASDRQWRFPLQETVPERFAEALIHYEDRRFRQHPGVDPLALARAGWQNLRAGRVVSGASTLSMQVIRIASGNPPRTLTAKARELLLALRLELSYSKDEILALYAQHAPFGGNLVGVETAAWRYFGRAAAELTWAEAAVLAVLPNSPGLIHPGRSRARLQAKRDRLLLSLHAAGRLTALDLRLALAEPLPEQPRPLPRLAPHLLDSLADGRVDAGQAGTPRWRSTLDADLQRALGEVMTREVRGLVDAGVHNAAALVIDNHDLSVLAYLGNSRHDDSLSRGHAIDLLQRPRSSGSVLKPLLYALLLQDGRILPQTLVADLPTQINGYAPENFDRSYRGAVPASEALALSLNIPAVRLLRSYGLQRFHAALQAMGMRSLRRAPEHYGLTLILGGAEATPWEVGQFYANLAAIAQSRGAAPAYRVPRLLIEQSATTIAASEYGAGAAWLTLQAMAEVNRPGSDSHWRNFTSSKRVAWKTGTSFGLRDAWAVGSTPRYTVAVWAGNAGGAGVAGLSGTQTAAPLLFAILNQLPDSGWFIEPVHDLKRVATCSIDGFLPREDCPTLAQWAPAGSHFAQASPYHRRLHLDARRQFRVHSGCEPVAAMQAASWFVLPAAIEHFYRRQHPEYRPLPPWRADCVAGAGADDAAIGLLYPPEGSALYIPAELDGERSRLVFEAVHRRRDARLHWHLGQQYLGSTRDFHQLEVLAAPGEHRLTLVDDHGERLSRGFSVLSKFGQR
jgi:penicillin-binding protein 1C